MTRTFSPRIEIFNPFEKPFSTSIGSISAEEDTEIHRIEIVDPEVRRYMRSGHRRLRIVAKCTPCQCCACR